MNMLESFKRNLKSIPSESKQKKSPSEYNKFIGQKIHEFKIQHPDIKGGHELMRMATNAWKLQKNMLI